MSLTPLCLLPQRERPEGITADPLQVCVEWMTEKGPFLYPVMPLEERCWGSAPLVMFHWKSVFVPQLGDGDLLVSGNSPESSILVTALLGVSLR